MKEFLVFLQQLKPAFLPMALWWLVLLVLAVMGVCIVGAGLWVVFTQIDFA